MSESKKTKTTKENSKAKQDTGSVEVQCAILTERITSLTEHCKIHSKDFSSRRGLLILVSRRRRLLDYLKSKSTARYDALITKLELRK